MRKRRIFLLSCLLCIGLAIVAYVRTSEAAKGATVEAAARFL